MEQVTSFLNSLNSLMLRSPELFYLGGGALLLIMVFLFILTLTRRGQKVEVKEESGELGEGAAFETENSLDAQLASYEEEVEKASYGEEPLEEEIIIEDEDIEDTREIEQEQLEAGEEESPVPEEEIIKDIEDTEEIEQEQVEAREEEIPVPEEVGAKEAEESREGLFSRLKSGLSKTQVGLLGKLDEVLSIRKEVDEELWAEFEEILVTADLGVQTTMKLRDKIEQRLTKKALRDPMIIREALREEILQVLKGAEGSLSIPPEKPFVIMVAGVNGVGKTTTIGKLAYRFEKEGKKTLIAAADTFRAAAVEQLEVWAERVGSDFIKSQSGADPSAVAFDALRAARARERDVLIIDTAGRLHTKTNLMEELKKIRRVIGRELEGAPHETLLVLDATMGQNAIQQAKLFREAVDVTGIALTKLDGTAKGGVIVAIADGLRIPVKFIGIGERLGDLREFNAEEFVEALFLTGEETLH